MSCRRGAVIFSSRSGLGSGTETIFFMPVIAIKGAIMRWLGVILASMMLLATTAAHAAQVAGFRGLPWGTELSSLSSAEFSRVFPIRGIAPEMESYQRKNDSLKLDSVVVDSINYNFKKGKLVSVNIDFNGFNNYEGLLAYCEKQMGPLTTSMAKNMELVTSFEAPQTGALIVFQAGASQINFGRLFLFSNDWLH